MFLSPLAAGVETSAGLRTIWVTGMKSFWGS